jgi:hypothetical protein
MHMSVVMSWSNIEFGHRSLLGVCREPCGTTRVELSLTAHAVEMLAPSLPPQV